MRLSEKSIELNFCRQVAPLVGSPAWWFGATQKEEQEAGGDVATSVAGTWLLFQMKASNHVLSSTGARRFRAQHHQLLELQARASHPLRVLYVLPTIGNTAELMAAAFDLIHHVRLIDVHQIPVIPAPTKADGAPRVSGLHYFDLAANLSNVTIRLEPVEVEALSLTAFGESLQATLGSAEEGGVEPLAAGDLARSFLGGGRSRVAAFIPSLG